MNSVSPTNPGPLEIDMTTEESYLGIVHGSTIELKQSLGIPDGAEVKITIKPNRMTGEQRKQKLEAAFGGCKEDGADMDKFLGWNKQQRRRDRTEQSL